MATVGLWPVKSRLKEVIDYADNPDKTANPAYLDSDLQATLQYAENDSKTDRKMFVSAINCPKQRAYQSMMTTKQRFGKHKGNVAYHGFQSFVTGEVTPEEAHKIGMETAKRMWGEKFEVVVTTHLNTDNLHNHFVVNSVSFKDGSKFANHHYEHLQLREISDTVCREYGKSVLEHTSFWGSNKKAYWLHKQGGKTHRDYLREDIEYCLSYSSTPTEFEKQLSGLGYKIDPVRFSVKAKHWQSSIRLAGIGFTREIINEKLRSNQENELFHSLEWNYHLPYKPKKFPLENLLKQLEFEIEHSYKPETVMIDMLFYIMITVFQLAYELKDTILLSLDLRAAEKDLKAYISDYHFLQKNNIRTIPQLQNCIAETQSEISKLEAQRNKISNQIRRPKSNEEQNENKERRRAVTEKLDPLRKNLRKATDILERSPHLYELLKNEHELEKKAQARYLERSR